MRARTVGHLESQNVHKRLSSPIPRFFVALSCSDSIENFLSRCDLAKGNGTNLAFFTVL